LETIKGNGESPFFPFSRFRSFLDFGHLGGIGGDVLEADQQRPRN
jgi:hypothetical protein